jgi:hypothetical protein
MNLLAIFALLVHSYIYNPNDWLQLSALENVRNITADPFYVYLIYQDGIGLINKSSQKLERTVTQADRLPGGILLGAYDPETGVIWLLTKNLLVGYNPTTRGTFSFPHSMANATSLGIGPKFVYLATDQAAVRFSKQSYRFEPAPTMDPQTIWYGARSPYQPRRYIFLTPYYYTDQNFRHYSMVGLFEDNNTLWVATNGYGVFAYDLFTKIPRHYRFGPAAAQVLKIYSDPSGLWFTNPDYISFYNPKADTWSYFDLAVKPLSSLRITFVKPPVYDLIRRENLSSVVWQNGAYWLGTNDGLYSFEPKTEALQPELNTPVGIRKILAAGDSVFLATDRGLLLFSEKTKTYAEIKDPPGKLGFGVFDIAETHGKRFFTCSGGLVSLDTLGNWEFRQIPGMDLLSHPGPIAGAGTVLFVAVGPGLIIYDETRNDYQRLDPNPDFSFGTINALLADKDFLWLGTNTGIARFSYHSLFPGRP